MIYEINDSVLSEIDINDFKDLYYESYKSSEIIYIGCFHEEELEKYYEKLGIPISVAEAASADNTHFRNNYEVYDTYSFGMLNIVNEMDINLQRHKLSFFIKKNFFCVTSDTEKILEISTAVKESIKKYTKKITLEKIIFSVLEILIVNGNISLEITEETIMKLEKTIIGASITRELNKVIFELKRQLIVQKLYYSQLLDIGEELQENRNGIFQNDDLRYFKIFTDRVNRLYEGTKILGDSVVHLREALEASLDYELNRITKIFTVVTTIFFPLSLIAAWYGMNFKFMPELTWKYGYIFVVSLSFIVIISCVLLFKKKKLI